MRTRTARYSLKEDLKTLSDDIGKLKEGMQSQLTERLDKDQELMRESIQKQFSASSKIIADVTERLTKLDETNKRVVDVASELKTFRTYFKTLSSVAYLVNITLIKS